MADDVKIDGSEPATGMTIYQHAILQFMTALSVLPRQKHREVALEATRYAEAFIDAANGEIYGEES